MSPKLEYFIYTCILLNTLILAISWYDEPHSVSLTMEILNGFFTVVFTIECVIKILGLGKLYFKESWNIFDFVIVLGTIVIFFISRFQNLGIGNQTTVLRAFRVGRMFRLLKRNKSLNIIFETFIVTLPALANVGCLLLLFLYIYSILGMNLFSTIKHSYELDSYANFENVPNAMLTLVRISTGENWHNILLGIINEKGITNECVENPSYEDYK